MIETTTRSSIRVNAAVGAPLATGARGERVTNLQAEFPCAPCLRRECGYRGPAQSWGDEVVRPACYARVTPEMVFEEARALLARWGVR